MKTLNLLFLALSLTGLSYTSFANTRAPVVAKYPGSSCVGAICASLARYNQQARLTVYYPGNRLQGEVKMGVIINGQQIALVPKEIGRDGITFHQDFDQIKDSTLAVYFVDNMGHYDSDSGGNFNFLIQK